MSRAIEIQAPEPIKLDDNCISVFLAGSIEMGTAENWQKKLVEMLEDESIIFFNPRRDDWDPTWEQSIDNKNFREQVEWELDALEQSDVIVMYFDPNTKSPISLLELGLFARTNKMIVVCPDGFWRKGNVDIVCNKYGITQVNDIDDLYDLLRNDSNY